MVLPNEFRPISRAVPSTFGRTLLLLVSSKWQWQCYVEDWMTHSKQKWAKLSQNATTRFDSYIQLRVHCMYVHTLCEKKLLFCHLIRRTWRPTAGRELGQWGRSTQAHISMPVSLAAVVSCLGWPSARVPGMTRRGGLFCPYLAGAARDSRWRHFCQNWVAITALTLIFGCLRSNMPSLFASFRV
jgi:hypothetical protein